MKRFGSFVLALLLRLLLARFIVQAQSVGIGTTTPDARAALDIQATDKGLLVPRLSAAQRTGIAAPPQGLMAYQTDGTAGGGIGTGFWYFGGAPAAWVFINPAGGGADNLGNGIATTAVNLQGNALVGTGASIGGVGVGVRADGGLNLGQNGAGNNVLLGYQAGATTTGTGNLFIGYQAGQRNSTGSATSSAATRAATVTPRAASTNSAATRVASLTRRVSNYFSGYLSGVNNTTGSANQFSGHFSGYANTTGGNNQFSGYQAGTANTTGDLKLWGLPGRPGQHDGQQQPFRGLPGGPEKHYWQPLQFEGSQAGQNNSTGLFNLFVANQAGAFNTTGNSNLATATLPWATWPAPPRAT